MVNKKPNQFESIVFVFHNRCIIIPHNFIKPRIKGIDNKPNEANNTRFTLTPPPYQYD